MVVNYVQQQGAAYVGKLVADGALIEGSPAHAALHTLSACAGAAAQGSSCGAAAFGAATASVVSSLLEDSAEVLTSEQKEARKNLIATLVTGVAAASGQAAAANTAALIEMENNSHFKNMVKVAINDAKDYVGKKGKEGLEKAVELLEKIEIKPLVEKQKEIGKFLDEAAARGGLTEGEIAVLGIIYAANEAQFPTSALDLIPGAGKAVGKTGMLVKAGMKAEDAAKIAIAEAKAAAQAGNYGKVGGHDVHAQAGANGGTAGTTGSSVNVGPWSKGITNVVENGTFTQCGNGSCVSATAQVLTNGTVTEAQVVARIGEWADPLKLPGVLNDLAPGATPWRGGYFGSSADAVTIANKGPMGAVLQAPGEAAHMVTISPVPGSPGMFRVQDTGVGKTYDVPASWIGKYVVGGVWK